MLTDLLRYGREATKLKEKEMEKCAWGSGSSPYSRGFGNDRRELIGDQPISLQQLDCIHKLIRVAGFNQIGIGAEFVSLLDIHLRSRRGENNDQLIAH